MKKINTKIIHEDSRGKIESIVKDFEWKEINKISSKKGTERGGHYHKNTHELIFLIKGSIAIQSKNIESGDEKKLELKSGEGVLIEPLETHKLKVLEDAEWITMLTMVFDENDPDIHV